MKCHLKTLAGTEYDLNRVTDIYVMGEQGGFCISGYNNTKLVHQSEIDVKEIFKKKNIFGHRKSTVEFTCNDGQVMKYDIQNYSDTLSMYNQIQLAMTLENV